jgi:hypothetical protein
MCWGNVFSGTKRVHLKHLLQNICHEKNNTADFVSYNPTSTLPSKRIHIQNSGIISNNRFTIGLNENIMF